jgi:hypothetical protein
VDSAPAPTRLPSSRRVLGSALAPTTTVKPRRDDWAFMEDAREGRLGFALLLACPACAGGFFLAIGTALGATALALKGFALAALLTLVLGLWARNAWRRRDEEKAVACAPGR